MTKQGLVSKHKGRDDRRRYEVFITSKGRELAEKMSRESIDAIFSILSETEMTGLRAVLRRLDVRATEVLRSDTEARLVKTKD
jgi:DNA-binding MarR family transcriptional regulator